MRSRRLDLRGAGAVHLAWAFSATSDGKNALSYAEQATAAARQSPIELWRQSCSTNRAMCCITSRSFKPPTITTSKRCAWRGPRMMSQGQLQALINLAASASYRRLDRGLSWAQAALRLAQGRGNL